MSKPVQAPSQSALDQYAELVNIITQHLSSLPQHFQNDYNNWKIHSDPIISSLNSDNASKATNLTSLLIKERLKPHELQKLRNQASTTHENNVLQLIDDLMKSFVTDPTLALPLPATKDDQNGINTVAVTTFNMGNLSIKKSKSMKSIVVFSMAGFLRAASDYSKQHQLYPVATADENAMGDEQTPKALTPQQIATVWVDFLIPKLEQSITSLANATNDVTNQWKYITVTKPTTDGRAGNLDFYFDIKAFVAAINVDENGSQNGPNDTQDATNQAPNAQKRKAIPQSDSPQLVPTASKQKGNGDELDQDAEMNGNGQNGQNDSSDNKNQLVSLDSLNPVEISEKVDREIVGLFDFAPTTGESRHCIDPETKDLQQFQFTAMGYINSCYRAKFSTPRQGNAAPSSHASLTLHNDVRFHSVLGLEQYSHVWLLFVFHSNAQGSYRPKITPPRLGERVGCLATRSPHRWNDIGLSLVKLDKIEYPENFSHLPLNHPQRQFYVHTPGINSKAKQLPGCARLILSNVDLIDGTPILDVKPFNPGDIIPNPKSLRLPTWLAEAPLFTLRIDFHKQAIADLYGIFHKYYNEEYNSLKTKADVFQRGVEQKDQKIRSMDKTTLGIYSNLYKAERLSKIATFVEKFNAFKLDTHGPDIVQVEQNAKKDIDIEVVEENENGEKGGGNGQTTTDTRDQVQEYLSYELGSPLQFYPTVTSIQQAIVDTLRNDPRPIWTKFENRNRAIFGFLYDNLNIVYQMNGDSAATVCFLQHRDEYNQICEQIKGDKKGDQSKLIEKKGWVDLIKTKITQTTVDPTDDWAKQIHKDQTSK